MRTVTAVLLAVSLSVAAEGLVLAEVSSSGPGVDGQRIEVPDANYALTLPADWVAMTSPDDMDVLIEDLVQAGGSEAGSRLQWRFGYLNIVMSDWPPLYVLPTDEGQALGCGIENGQGPQRLASEWVDEVESRTSAEPIGLVSSHEPTWVDLSTGRHLLLRHVSTAGGQHPLHRTTFLIGGDDTEITVTCQSLGSAPDEYWNAVVDGFAPLLDAERRIELPSSGFALTVPGGWWVRTRGLGLVDATEDAEQHLWVQDPSGHLCVVWHWDRPPGDGAPGSGLDAFAAAFAEVYRDEAIRLRVSAADLPVGPAVRVDDELPSIGVHRAAWLLAHGSGFYSLTCGGPSEPDEALLPIAETFEVLPAEG